MGLVDATSEPAPRDIRELLGSIAEYLREVGPEEDLAGMYGHVTRLRAEFPRLRTELCARRDEHSGASQYHVLVGDPGAGTYCITYAPTGNSPWALLGAQRWKESELLVVNGRTLTVREAAVLIDFMWKDSRVCRDLVAACLLRREFELDGTPASDSEVETFVEEFRRRHRLYSGKSFEEWLSVRGMTLAQFLCEARERAALVALRRRKTRGAERYFQERRAEFERVEVLRCPFDSEEEAAAGLASLGPEAGGGTSEQRSMAFWRLAEARAEAASDSPPARRASLFPSFGVYWRRELTEASADLVFATAPGRLAGPLTWGTTVDLVKVVRFKPACFDLATRALIEETLFNDWLQHECGSARIEWNWGPGRAEDAGAGEG
jgi:putative peptide maturation system protein